MQRQFDRLLLIIKLIFDDKIGKARASISELRDKELAESLKIILERSSYSLKAQNIIISLLKDRNQRDVQIIKLKTKINHKQFSNRKKILPEVQNQKLKVIELIQSENFSQALQISKDLKLQITPFINQLCEYRSLKKLRQFLKTRTQTSFKKYEPSWTTQGQSLRAWLQKQSKLVRQVNKKFCHMIENFFNNDKNALSDMHIEYFTHQTRQKFEQLYSFIWNFKQFATQNVQKEDEFMKKVVKQLKDIGSDILKDYKPSCSIFWICETLFQGYKKFKLYSEVTSESFEKKNRESVKFPLDGELSSLIQQINKAIAQYQTIDIIDSKLIYDLKNPKETFMDILGLIKKILNLNWGKQSFISFNKQVLQTLNDQSILLEEMIIEIANKLELSYLTRSLIYTPSNISQIAFQIKKKIKQIVSQNEQIRKKLDIQKSRKEQVEAQEQQEIELPLKRIKTSQNNFQDVLEENNSLKQQLQELKKKYSEAKQLQKQLTEVSHRHKEAYLVLQRKNKINQTPYSSYFIPNNFGEKDFEKLSLLEQKDKILIQKQTLEKQLQDKNNLIENFQKIKLSIRSQKQAQKQKQVSRLKQIIKELKQELNDSFQQSKQLFMMLQEKNQLIKSQSQILLPSSEINRPQQKRIQQQLDQHRIAQIQNIHENCIKQREINQAQTQILLKKQNQLLLQIHSLEDSLLKHQKDFSEQKMKILKRHKQQIESLSSQLEKYKQKCNNLQIKQITNIPFNLQSNHLFAYGTSMFNEEDHEQRLYLIQTLRHYCYKLKKTRLLYRLDEYNKTSFHRYIDHHTHIVVIIKTLMGKFIAGYYQKPLISNGIEKGFGMIMSLWNKRTYLIRDDKKAISYDDYFIIFGNSQIRMKNLQYKIFSNFGISNSYYDHKGMKIDDFLGQDKNREVQISGMEIYSLQFDI